MALGLPCANTIKSYLRAREKNIRPLARSRVLRLGNRGVPASPPEASKLLSEKT
jgi:hypothetical protein